MAPSAISTLSDTAHPVNSLKSTKTTVTAKPITEAEFAPYGGLVATGLQIPASFTFPNAQKSLEVVPTTNRYADAPSQVPGRHVLHVERVDSKIPEGKPRSLVLERMERHPFTSQTFVPMGGAEVGYLAIVADGNAANDAPDLATLKVFSVGEGQGVCYEAGVWHASMHVVGRVSFGIFDFCSWCG